MLTLVLTALNRQELLPRTLESIGAQSLRPLRVVAVDNGSTDATPQILRDWATDMATKGIDVTVLTENNPGASAARNAGMHAVTTPFVAFFDSDDEMRPGHLQRIVDFFSAHPDSELMAFDAVEMDPDGWTTLKSVADDNAMRGHILPGSLATQRWAASTALLRRLGGWDESLPSWNDLELGVRLLVNASKPVFVHGDPGVVIHPSDDSISAPGYAARAPQLLKAIETMELTLTTAGRTDDLHYTDAKRMILSGLIRREAASLPRERRQKIIRFAERIEAPALDRNETLPISASRKGRRRLVLIVMRTVVRIFGRGGAAIASLLAPAPRS